MISGIDISENNGKINWSQFGNCDVKFAYIKATEFLDSVDLQYAANVQSAKNAGLLIGAYHWLNPDFHVGQQVDLFIRTVKNFKGMLPPAVCIQSYEGLLVDIEKNIRSFLMLLEKKTGVKPVIYTSDSFWKSNITQSDWGCNYPLWIDMPGNFWPNQLWPWAGWTFWQCSYKETIPGIQTAIGINQFNGSIETLHEMIIQ